MSPSPNLFCVIHHLKLIHLKPGLPPQRVEEMMTESRIRILKIQDVLSLACGKKIPGKEETPHDLFLALEFENSLKRTAAFASWKNVAARAISTRPDEGSAARSVFGRRKKQPHGSGEGFSCGDALRGPPLSQDP
ncbi:hypothetical protein EBS57_07315 [bacterium]|nr:hypothetical protein [bacterium]